MDKNYWGIDLVCRFAKISKYKKKRNKSYAHYGPVLAGGKLWVASSDGFLRGFSPISGKILNQIPLSNGAASHPAIVNGVLYILNQRGQLLAFE